MLRFESTLASRHLRSGGGQTLLTISAVATGVLVVIFISSLIFGVCKNVSDMLTDTLPQVTVTPPEPDPMPLAQTPGATAGLSLSRIERQTQQRKDIENWQKVDAVIRSVPEVVAVAPAVTGQGFVSRGSKSLGATLYGADPDRMNVVTPMTKYLVSGHYLGLRSDETMLSYKLAEDLSVGIGDRVRLTSSEGISDAFTVAGICDTGEDQLPQAFIVLRSAQSLYGTGTAVRSLLIKTDDLYRADRVADRLLAILPYKVDSWSRQHTNWVSSLSAWTSVAYLVSIFSLVATSFAIASVLIVSVLQKGKQIGILKSMGALSRQILIVFLLEGLGIALIGAAIGALLGCGALAILRNFKRAATHAGGTLQPVIPQDLTWQLVVVAMLAAVVATVLAASLPARRAAKLDPVQMIK